MDRSARVIRSAALGAALAGVAALTLAAGPASQGAAAASVPTVTVNAAAPFRAVTHVGAGGLYALANPGVPAASLLYPLHLNSVVQMAPGGQQLPNGEPAPAGDALVVAPSAIGAGASEII